MSAMTLLRGHFVWRAIFGLICVVGCFLFFFANQAADGLPKQRPFDQEAWIVDPDELDAYGRAGPDGPNFRAHMVTDVLENVLHRGMSREDVEALLGPPDRRNWSQRFPVNGWDLGTWTNERSSEALVLSYDNADRLITARVTESGSFNMFSDGVHASWSLRPDGTG